MAVYCPFLSTKADPVLCQEKKCKLWVNYFTPEHPEGTGDCPLHLLGVMGLPTFGAGLKTEV